MKHPLEKMFLRKVFSQKILFFLFLGLISVASVQAQKTISGTIKDQKGEAIIGASVSVKGNPGLGDSSQPCKPNPGIKQLQL